MNIRNATYRDAASIRSLLAEQGHNTRTSILIDQLEMKFTNENNQVFVCEKGKDVIGFIAVHFLPQLTRDVPFVVISSLLIDQDIKENWIARELEQFIVQLARKRNCEVIEVRCSASQMQVHDFYTQQGYQLQSDQYVKRLLYGD